MLVPPPDDDKEHGCAWRDYAVHLGAKLEVMEAEMEVLKRAFAKRSEKMGKMPRVPRPPRTPEEAADRRTEQALLRADKVVTEDKTDPVPEALKKCHLCGGTDFRSVGTGKPSEIYSYVPGYFRRIVHTREVVACRCGGCVITAPAPERWAEKTRYDSSFVAHLVVSKCLVVTPLYRLEQSFARLGMPIARSTMNDLFRRAGQKLEPLRAPLFEAINHDFLVHADETSFTMTKQTSKAFIWAFVGRSLTGYRFDLTRGGDVPVDVLGESTGAFLCDDYRGYDPLAKKGKRQRCGCLAHYLELRVIRRRSSSARSRRVFGAGRHIAGPDNGGRSIAGSMRLTDPCRQQSTGRGSSRSGPRAAGHRPRSPCICTGPVDSTRTVGRAGLIPSGTSRSRTCADSRGGIDGADGEAGRDTCRSPQHGLSRAPWRRLGTPSRRGQHLGRRFDPPHW